MVEEKEQPGQEKKTFDFLGFTGEATNRSTRNLFVRDLKLLIRMGLNFQFE
jgi:hypothetical protein